MSIRRSRATLLIVGFFCAAGWALPAAARPVHHVVLFKFKADASAREIHDIVQGVGQLPSKIPGITGYQWGRNNSPEGLDKGFTHAFVLSFESAEALAAYAPHPAHQEFAESALPRIESVFVYDFLVDEAPEPAEPGRTHHLVFFKYKDSASAEAVGKVRDEFLGLEKKIPGLL
ncbi:MAG: Dabb family protein, partial [Planctomycetes bacterium]|nr:Dabb family protein [Planctomycetota bacterium]